jgi:hypothetical protein
MDAGPWPGRLRERRSAQRQRIRLTDHPTSIRGMDPPDKTRNEETSRRSVNGHTGLTDNGQPVRFTPHTSDACSAPNSSAPGSRCTSPHPCSATSYVPTWSGTVFTAFVSDVFSRRIIRWRCWSSMPTKLPLDALEWRCGPVKG